MRQFDAQLARQVLAGQRFDVRRDVRGLALRDDAPAVHAGTQAHVHHVVGTEDHVLVVLHHQHRIAQVAQPFQRADQALVVALVQADAGLVQHVHHARQPAADLAGQADALRLAARQRVGAAVQAQVVQAHVVQELQPRADLAHDLVGNLGLGAAQLQAFEIGQRVGQGLVFDAVDRFAGRVVVLLQEDVACLAPQPRTRAIRAGFGGLVARQVLAHRGGIRLAKAPLQVGQDAFEGVRALHRAARPLRLPALRFVDEGDVLFARAVQQHLLRLFGSDSKAASMSKA